MPRRGPATPSGPAPGCMNWGTISTPFRVALGIRRSVVVLAGHEDTWTDRYLLCEHLVDPPTAKSRQQFEALSRFIRDLLAHRWVKTRRTRTQANPKRVHYLSMEFLLGRTLHNNLLNLSAEPLVQKALHQVGWD